MIHFGYRLAGDETPDAASLTSAGFTAYEQAGVGRAVEGETVLYRLIAPQPPGVSYRDAGEALVSRAKAEADGEILQENGGAFATPRELWLLLESALQPRIKIAWSAAAARAANRTAAMAVPTLNLRLGLVRIDQLDDEALSYVKRLAGIGFEGYVVIDPPAASLEAGATRLAQAKTIADALKAAIAPRKATKAVAKAKP